jgi:purine nucleoside phosphorylase
MVERVAGLKFVASESEHAARTVRARISDEPRVAVVLGSGLGAFADDLEGSVAIPYEEIPVLYVRQRKDMRAVWVVESGRRAVGCDAGPGTLLRRLFA